MHQQASACTAIPAHLDSRRSLKPLAVYAHRKPEWTSGALHVVEWDARMYKWSERGWVVAGQAGPQTSKQQAVLQLQRCAHGATLTTIPARYNPALSSRAQQQAPNAGGEARPPDLRSGKHKTGGRSAAGAQVVGNKKTEVQATGQLRVRHCLADKLAGKLPGRQAARYAKQHGKRKPAGLPAHS